MTTSKVQAEFIATNAISGTIIADNAITATHIATNAISGVLIQDSGIVSTMIAANNVTAAKIVTNGVLTRHVLDDNITAAKLANSINTDIATGVTANTTANAALPKAGGTMTGNIVMGDDTSIGIGDSAERIEFDGAGDISVLGANFGIGETSPDGPLHITSNTPIIVFDESDASQEYRIGSFGGAFALYDSTDSAYRIIVNGDGKVGIGTTSPGAELDLRGDLRLDSGGTTSRSIYFRNQDTSATGGGKIQSDQYLSFYAGNGSGTPTQYLTIKPAGNVGIGTASPTLGKLEVQDATGGADKTVAHFGAHIYGEPSYTTYINLGTEYGDGTSRIGSINTTGNQSSLVFETHAAGSGSFTERMRIDNTGKVGIGTTSPRTLLHASASAQNQTQIGNCRQFSLTDSAGYDATRVEMGMGYWHPTHTYQPVVLGAIITDDGGQPVSDFYIATKSSTDGDDAPIERFRITKDGKTGIGIDAPTHKLHAVSGDAKGFFLNRTSGSNPANLAEYSTHYSLSILNRASGSYLNFGGTADYSSMQATDGAGSPAAKIISLNPHGGNVGIGETVPIRKLVVNHPGGSSPHNGILLHADVDTANGTNGLYFKNDSTNDDRRMKGAIIFERDDPGTRGTGKLHLCVEGVNSDTNVAVNHSRLAIHADGNIHTKSLFVDTTTDNSVSNDDGIVLSDGAYQVIRRSATMLYLHHTAGSGTGTLVAINKAQATVGTITATNSNAAYNTSSDYRLKENVDYTWDATTRLKQLKPARFNWVIDSTNTLQDGFMAHEVQSIVPEAVTGTKDAVWSAEEEENGEGTEGAIKGQQMDHSKLVPLLVKTVQELEARIATLEG